MSNSSADAFWRKPFTREEIEKMRRMGRASDFSPRGFWRAFRRIARNVPFARDLLAAYACVRDPATPRSVKLALAAALAYFAMPFDAVPDFLPLLGFSDDAAVLAATIAMVRNAITTKHYAEAEDMLHRDGGAGA